MTEHDLKEMKNLGAELGAAKAENERLRAEVEALRVALLGIAQVNPAERCIEWAKSYASDGLSGTGSELYIRWLETFKEAEALRKDADRRATLSQQAEPTDTYTAVDMATAAAQGFRDGQAAVEQATAQDEQQPIAWFTDDHLRDKSATTYDRKVADRWRGKGWPVHELYARHAQTEQQPVAVPESWWQLIHDTIRNYRLTTIVDADGDGYELIDAMTAEGQPVSEGIEECTYLTDAIWNALLAAPVAQTAPQGKFAMHQRVRKTSGSEWQGRICGTYSTALTPEGYAVESEAHAGSVQIYPAKALEAVE